MAHPDRPTRAARAWILAGLVVFVVAFGLRFGHLYGLRESFAGTELFDLVRGDMEYHWNEALTILDEDFWLSDRIPWKGPGYSYFLAGMIAVLGPSPAKIRWALAALGALNCVGLWWLARRLLPPAWSLAVGLLAAANGTAILFDGELLFPTLLVSLALGVFLLIGRTGAGAASHAAAGVLLGLSCMVHAVYLVPAALLTSATAARRRPAHAAALGIAVAATIAPWTIQNYVVRGQPILISWNGGINIYASNHPAFDQYSGNSTNAWVRIARTPVDAGIEPESARDRLYYRLAWRDFRDHPLTTARILLQKTWIFLSPVEYANNIRIYELRDHSPVLAVTLGRFGPLWWPFGLLGPAIVVGLVLALRRAHPLTLAYGVWALGLLLAVAISFNTARYRLPAAFFGTIFAVFALRWITSTWLSGLRRPALAATASVVALAGVLGATAVPQHAFPPPLEWEQAAALMERGRFAEAEPWVERAVERHPDEAPLRFAVSGFYVRWGRPEAEREQLLAALALPDLEPDLIAYGHELLAVSWFRQGRLDEARREYETALAVHVDETVWKGMPFYQMGLGPLTQCWLELGLAQVELAADRVDRADELVARVRGRCPEAGRLRDRLGDLERTRVVVGRGGG